MEDLASINASLKEYYPGDVIVDMVTRYSPIQKEIFETIDTKETDFQGREVIEMPVFGFNQGVSSIGEKGEFPRGGKDVQDNYRTKMKYSVGSIEMTWAAMKSSFDNLGAFQAAIPNRIKNMVSQMAMEDSRKMIGSGNGILARVNGAHAAVSVINIDDPLGITGSFGAAKHIAPGMVIAFTDGVTVSALSEVSSINVTGSQITLTAPVTVVDNINICRASTLTNFAMDSNSFNNEEIGLLGMVDDGGFSATNGGLSRAIYSQLKSRVETGVGLLSTDALYRNFDFASSAGNGNVEYLICNDGVRRAYLAIQEAQKRFIGENLDAPNSGTQATNFNKGRVPFGGTMFIADSNFPYNMLMGISKKTMFNDSPNFVTYEQGKGDWVMGFKSDGAQWRPVGRSNVWEANFYRSRNRLCRSPISCFRMEGITSTNIYVPKF